MHIIKPEDEALDGPTKLMLLHRLRRCDGQASNDSAAVDVCTELLRRTPVRGGKKILMITDGYGRERAPCGKAVADCCDPQVPQASE